MYKIIYKDNKRTIIFKNALQLMHYLGLVDVKHHNFKLYKKKGK